jgi:hypothetical protein
MPEGQHRCPGGCGSTVPDRLFSCPDCWAELPPGIRRRLCSTVRTGGRARVDAIVSAKRFYLGRQSG